MRILLSLSIFALVACSKPAATTTDPAKPSAPETAKAEAPKVEPKVFFVSPMNGAKVFSPVFVKFGVQGKEIRPAGEEMMNPAFGHHHLVIDGGPVAQGAMVPMDDQHIHYGKGQTETTVELKPGEHTLTMQFANGAHMSYGEPLSATISVTVLPTPEKLGVGFKNLKDNDKVTGEFEVQFDVFGMDIKPAGEDLTSKVTGHHHLIIDGKPIPSGELVPMNDTHIHFGKGDTSTKITLTPGPHTLTLQFADGAHLSYGEAMSATINVVAE